MDVMLTFYPGQRNEIISPSLLELQIHHHPSFYSQCLSAFATIYNYVMVTNKHIRLGRYHKGQSSIWLHSGRVLGKLSVSGGECMFWRTMERYTMHYQYFAGFTSKRKLPFLKLNMLYCKDFMVQFVKTIGYMQPSYVIQKVTAVSHPMLYRYTDVYVHFVVFKWAQWTLHPDPPSTSKLTR